MSLVMNISTDEISRLLAAIDPCSSEGFFDIEDEAYQAIDQEMVKLGGLHEASIDWPFIEEASREYLSRQCKHFRIVGHLGVAWLRSGCWERWSYTLELLAGMVEQYWETAYPKPGPTGYPGKRKLVGLLLKRLTEALPQLDRFSYSAPRAASAAQTLACLAQKASFAKLDAMALDELKRLLLKHASLAIGLADRPAQQTATAAASAVTLSEAFLPTPATVSLGNERETRRAVLVMAEFINQQDLYDPTGYQLRRFGLWAHIHSAPSASRDHCTELMGVPIDIASRYEEAISSAAIDTALLLRVEKSVTAAPFWIRGSFLAATIAARLDMNEVAEAIRCATARFVRRLPALQKLCFSDGRVFVDEQSMAWLKGSEAKVTQGYVFQELRPLQEELVARAATEGVEAVLLQLQTMQADHPSPRERCHTTLIAADLLAARGVAWLAQDLCAGVARTMQAITAQAWEPEIFQKLQQYGAPSALIEEHKELAPR